MPGIAARLSGPWSLLAWVIVAISASCVLLSLASVSFRFTSSNSFYSLFVSVFGARIAVPLIILYLISSIFGVSTIAAGIGQYITYFGLSHVLLIEIVIIGAFCWLNITGISFSGMTENILTTLKIIPLVIISILLIPFIKIIILNHWFPSLLLGCLQRSSLCTGLLPVLRSARYRLRRHGIRLLIRRSLIMVMGIVVSVYLLLNVSLIGSVGAEALAASPAPVATAAGILFNHSGSIVACIGIVAMLSAINAYIIGTSRILQSMSAGFSIPVMRDLNTRVLLHMHLLQVVQSAGRSCSFPTILTSLRQFR